MPEDKSLDTSHLTDDQKEWLAGFDAEATAEGIAEYLRENPIFRAVRVQNLYSGEGQEVFDAVFQYSDSLGMYIAQGTHVRYPRLQILEYDSTWYSTCYRAVVPQTEWRYRAHHSWWKTAENLRELVPALPLVALVTPDDVSWRAINLHRWYGPLEFVVEATLSASNVRYTLHLRPESEHPFQVLTEKVFIGDWLSATTTHYYDVEDPPVVHTSREDCLSRNPVVEEE